MDKGRLEAFTDAMVAIMVLELRPTEGVSLQLLVRITNFAGLYFQVYP